MSKTLADQSMARSPLAWVPSGRYPLLVAAIAVAAIAAASIPARAATFNVDYDSGHGCQLFAASATPGYSATNCELTALQIRGGIFPTPTVAEGTEENLSATAPAGITIVGATASFAANSQALNGGWTIGDFFTGGGLVWNAISSPVSDPAFVSSRWGFQLACTTAAGCSGVSGNPPANTPAEVDVSAVTFTASESATPSIEPAGASNLYDQTSGFAWNPGGDPWSIAASVSDPSGVCDLNASVNDGPAIPLDNIPHAPGSWVPCASGNGTFPGSIDTQQYVPQSGALALAIQATNAADPSTGPNTTTITHTIQVDNDPVQESLTTPNDLNPTLWVNHAVTVQSAASAGPSGISATSCSVDGGAKSDYPAGGLTVDGDGAHTVSCTASNGAVDPQGAHNTGTASQTIKIDEAPPAVGFEPVNPSDPTALVVDTSDAESGVGGGSITVQGPHAKAPRPLKTLFDGSHLVSRFDDAGKHGVFTFVVTSCDAVANCAAGAEALHFPIRLGSQSFISFRKIAAPARVVHARVRVDYRLRTVVRRRHGKRVHRTIKIGGHLRQVKIRVDETTGCGSRRIRVGRHRFQEIRVCRKLVPHLVTRHRQRLGRRVKLHGLLTTKQGRPLAHVRVAIATRAEDRGGRFHRVLVAQTDKDGVWHAKLPGGPSRAVRARYAGSRTIEPATARAELIVPAEIRLRITPHVAPWSHEIQIRGHLVGRFVPHDGVALRLLVRYPGSRQATSLQALRSNRHGAFAFRWSYHSGRGVVTYPFSVATTATETDYPYAAGASRPVRVTFGRRAARNASHHRRHRGG